LDRIPCLDHEIPRTLLDTLAPIIWVEGASSRNDLYLQHLSPPLSLRQFANATRSRLQVTWLQHTEESSAQPISIRF